MSNRKWVDGGSHIHYIVYEAQCSGCGVVQFWRSDIYAHAQNAAENWLLQHESIHRTALSSAQAD